MDYQVELIKEKLRRLNIVFFDLDGTLINTEHLYFRFWKEASKYYGYELGDEETLSMRSRERKSAEEYLYKVSGGLLDYNLTRNKRIELMNEYFKDHPIELKEGAEELLQKLSSEGKKLYIVTANAIEKSEGILKSTNISSYFTSIISAKEVERGKPYPDVYLYACAKIVVSPDQVIVFEDSPNGLISSFKAGCFTVMVEDLTPFTKDMDYVDGAISSLNKLI